MKTELSLEYLNEKSVSVITTKCFEDEGAEYRMAPHTRAFVNSAWGREELSAELPEPYLSAVLAAWGDAPTVEEPMDTAGESTKA